MFVFALGLALLIGNKKRLTPQTAYGRKAEGKLLKLGLFRKPKIHEEPLMEEKPSETSESTPQPASTQETPQEQTSKDPESKTYLRAMPLRDLADLENIKAEVNNGNILILKITPLANKNILDVSRAVNDLYTFAETIGGDIARLGEERIVICPPKIKIWREKTPAKNELLPTAA